LANIERAETSRAKSDLGGATGGHRADDPPMAVGNLWNLL